MYTAKLSLSPDNVEDVLAVAGFLQMQEIVSACNALKSLSVPPENPPGMSQQPPEIGMYPPGFSSPRESQDLPTYASSSPKFIHLRSLATFQTHFLGTSGAPEWGWIPLGTTSS